MRDGTAERPDERRARPGLLRRTLLRAAAGVGGLAAVRPGSAADAADAATDPHTRATFRAVVDAVVPETPALAAERGAAHGPGGLAVELDDLLVWGLNNFLRANPTPEDATEAEARLSESVAALLDGAAAELLARGENEDAPAPLRFPAGGPFAALGRRDRFRALHLVETHEVDPERLPAAFSEFEGDLSHVVVGLHALAVAGYYAEWAGYENGTASPDEWRWRGDVQSFAQTGFPGPSDGYAALRGYRVRQFRENDWRDDGNGGGGS